MGQPVIYVGTYQIKEGKRDDFARYWREFVEFVEVSEPRLIAFNAYVNEEGDEVAVVQVHPDGDSVEFHMKVIREHMEHAAWEFLGDVVSEHVYGVIGDATLETMRQFGARSSRSSLWALAASPAPRPNHRPFVSSTARLGRDLTGAFEHRWASVQESVRALLQDCRDPTMRRPDLIGQAVELGQVLLTVRHLAAPPFGVDGQDLVEVLGDLDAVEVQLFLRREDAHRRVTAGDLAALELHEP